MSYKGKSNMSELTESLATAFGATPVVEEETSEYYQSGNSKMYSEVLRQKYRDRSRAKNKLSKLARKANRKKK